MGSQKDNSSVKKIVSVTSGALEEIQSFRWKIENFEVVYVSPDLIKEQCFHFDVGHNILSTQWFCDICKENDECGIFLNLKKITCPSPPQVNKVCASFQVRKIKPNGETYSSRTVTARSFTPGSGYGFPKFFSNENADSIKQLLWEDGSRVIEVDFRMFAIKPVTLDLNERVKIFEKKEMQNFINSMTQMLENENKMDDMGKVKVVTKDKVEFFVSPAILSARSTVFRAMFSSGNWKEGKRPEGGASLVLEDLSGKTVKVLLHYLYGSVLLQDDWRDEDVILELTWAAEKYQLEALSEFLDNVLPELPLKSTEVIGKLALLTKRLGMKNSETGLLRKLKEEANDIDQLVLNKDDSLLDVPTKDKDEM